MDPTLPVVVALVGIGFLAGYGVRAWISARRRKAAKRNRW
jgi:arginine exporter protein ArgO